MSIVSKTKRALRGEMDPGAAALEVLRRGRARVASRRERAELDKWKDREARLRSEFAKMTGAELLDHFRTRAQPIFFPGFSQVPVNSFSADTKELVSHANRIVEDHTWPLPGIGEKNFGREINWHRDPLSGADWPIEYHSDLNLFRTDGSDVRVLWELNRLNHLVTLACAYLVTKDERFSVEFVRQVQGWHSQNPYGMGANWNCAMEVALRSINLLGAFEVFRRSSLFDAQKLSQMLALFDQHGSFIRNHLEFSYIATSNHYLSDVVGLVWLGTMLPELESARSWREFGTREMLREMDKQVLADGADFESSTGYHRFVLELLLYTFILCRANNVEIEQRYWEKLRQMLRYVRAYLRPDGRAPLIGDSDSGRIFPIVARSGDDHGYLSAIGGVVFNDANLIDPQTETPEELIWFLGEQAVSDYQKLRQSAGSEPESSSFPAAGIYIQRDRDLYLLFNASGAGINGRGSHGHNDALSIEVSACGRAFIVDPGTYVYTADLEERHSFRSTSYHSTVQIDRVEQNSTDKRMPFVIGDEAHPHAVSWETGEQDRISAEHRGYTRLPHPVIHRRTVTFNKQHRLWLMEDEFEGGGRHELDARFHFDTGLEVHVLDERTVSAYDKDTGARLLVTTISFPSPPDLENQFTSRDYGSKTPSTSARWSSTAAVPLKLNWAIVPVCSGEDEGDRVRLVQSILNDRTRS